ncbi:hypothetical protein GCM10029992_19310 [Glycomyces albus]
MPRCIYNLVDCSEGDTAYRGLEAVRSAITLDRAKIVPLDAVGLRFIARLAGAFSDGANLGPACILGSEKVRLGAKNVAELAPMAVAARVGEYFGVPLIHTQLPTAAWTLRRPHLLGIDLVVHLYHALKQDYPQGSRGRDSGVQRNLNHAAALKPRNGEPDIAIFSQVVSPVPVGSHHNLIDGLVVPTTPVLAHQAGQIRIVLPPVAAQQREQALPFDIVTWVPPYSLAH